jgi:catechol 2,3-dioxygenase-like lactoylglutathione lyase family enzyme
MQTPRQLKGAGTMDMKLEVVVIPVSDVDRAKAFYEKLGFHLDIDLVVRDDFRIVQFTPPGSDASIHIGKGITSAPPGSLQNIYLIVSDIEKAREDVAGRGVKVSEIFHRGPSGPIAGPSPEHADYSSFATFSDPDGNSWLLQEIHKRLPGRVSSQLLDAEMTDVLLSALQNAAAAHGLHEKELGRPDPDWPKWYANHMTTALTGDGFRLVRTSLSNASTAAKA